MTLGEKTSNNRELIFNVKKEKTSRLSGTSKIAIMYRVTSYTWAHGSVYLIKYKIQSSPWHIGCTEISRIESLLVDQSQ